MVSLVVVVGGIVCLTLVYKTGVFGNSLSIASENEHYTQARDFIEEGRMDDARAQLELALEELPENWGVQQLLGATNLKLGNVEAGITLLGQAIASVPGVPPAPLCANYLEALRAAGRLEEALVLIEQCVSMHGTDVQVLENSGHVLAQVQAQLSGAVESSQNSNSALTTTLLLDGAPASPGDFFANAAMLSGPIVGSNRVERLLTLAFDAYIDAHDIPAAVRLTDFFLETDPDHPRVVFLRALVLQHQNLFDEGIAYIDAASSRGVDDPLKQRESSKCAMLQVLGRIGEAIDCYESCLDESWNSPGVLNNYGSALLLVNKEEGIGVLGRVLNLVPDMLHTLVNLAGYYQDEGSMDKTDTMLSRALKAHPSSNVRVRRALITAPTSRDYVHIVSDRLRMEARLRGLLMETSPRIELDSSLDRVPFYPVYHGFNDRVIMELVGAAYRARLEGIVNVAESLKPSLDTMLSDIHGSSRKVRVAFVSRYFGVYEPHGMLLDGVMMYLPRDRFHVMALPVVGTDDKPLSYVIRDNVDEVVPLSLSRQHALTQIESLHVDVLILADTLSEPQTHFLAQSRMAPVQMAFWGNPITSASSQIDYFISADAMEHPYRTRIRGDGAGASFDEPYSEQVVLLGGQGIWYFSPESTEAIVTAADPSFMENVKRTPEETGTLVLSRADLDIPRDAVVFFCPQSVFKMHPYFDDVLAEITSLSPKAYVIVTQGRRPKWTKTYNLRLRDALHRKYTALVQARGGPANLAPHERWAALLDRLVSIPRVTAQYFDALLARMADVMIHPFPFDGSRTSADGLVNGIPILTLPTEYLRGRMGVQFYRTMNMPELTAHNRSEYIHLARRLVEEPAFLAASKEKVRATQHLIFEDLEVPYEWTRLLCGVGGVEAPSWDDFLIQSGRNVTQEKALMAQRKANRAQFTEVWGKEEYLLNDRGEAAYELYPAGYVTTRSAAEIPGNAGVLVKDMSALNGFIPREYRASNVSQVIGSAWHFDMDVELVYRPLPPRIFRDWLDIPSPSSSTVQPHSFTQATAGLHRDALSQPLSAAQKGQLTSSDTTAAAWMTLLDPNPHRLARTFPEVQAAVGSKEYDLALENLQSIIDSYSQYTPAELLVDDEALYEMGRALLEKGTLCFALGYHECALESCAAAHDLVPAIGVADACAGGGALHAGKEEAALAHLHRSLEWNLANPDKLQRPDCYPNMDVATRIRCTTITDVPAEEAVKTIFKAYWYFNRSSEAADFAMEYLQLPFPGRKEDMPAATVATATKAVPDGDDDGLYYGGIYVLIFSFVDWSPFRIPDLHRTETKLLATGRMRLPPNRSLVSEIRRIQQQHGQSMDAIVQVMHKYHNGTVVQDASNLLMDVVAAAEARANQIAVQLYVPDTSAPDSDSGNPSSGVSKNEGIVLISGYYLADSNVVMSNMDAALFKNLANPYISHVVLLCEHAIPDAFFADKKFINLHKIKAVIIGRRITFADAFAVANDNFAGHTVAIANSDIYFDTSLARLGDPRQLDLKGNVLALLRWRDAREFISLTLRTDSQDAWIFQAPINETLTSPEAAGFYFGTPRCDNVLAHVLQQSGHEVQNPAFSIHAIEIALAGTRPEGDQFLYGTAGAVEGTGREVILSDRFVFN